MDLPFWLECSRTFILRKCRYWLLLSTAIVVKVFLSGASWIKRNPKFFQKSLFTLLCGWFVVTLSSTLIGWLKVNKARLKKCIASMPPREQNQCFLTGCICMPQKLSETQNRQFSWDLHHWTPLGRGLICQNIFGLRTVHMGETDTPIFRLTKQNEHTLWRIWFFWDS